MPTLTRHHDPVEDAIRRTLMTLHPEMVNLCQRLIQTPSVNGVNDEFEVAELLSDQARHLGLAVQLVGANSRRPNVIMSTSEQGQTGLLLLGHLDTVAVGDAERWTYPPFSGEIADSRIYGRGAIDTKGGIAAALYALAALCRIDQAIPVGRIQLICVPDEESGATGELGIKYLFSQGLLQGLGAIYAYAGNEIILGHRGVLRYRLICNGQAVHSGSHKWQERSKGANAVTGMARLLIELENMTLPYSAVKYFDRFRTVLTPGTMIKGGAGPSSVPDYCEVTLDIRTIPDLDRASIERLLDTCIQRLSQPNLTFRYELLNELPPAISDEQAPLFSIAESVIHNVKSYSPPRVVAGPANEGYLLIERDIPTICGLGPTGKNAHATDEYVEIQGLLDAAVIFALIARRLSMTS